MKSIIQSLFNRKKSLIQACAELKPGDVAIDLGANIGQQTLFFSYAGAEVHAFEPDKLAFEMLKAQMTGRPDAYLFNQAVSDKNGKLKLYMKKKVKGENPYVASLSSSLYSDKISADKVAVDKNNFYEVDVIDIAQYIYDLNKPIKILKMDIEGSEYDVLNKILDLGLHKRIKYIFAETHGDRISSLTEADQRLRERIRNENINNIDLNWI